MVLLLLLQIYSVSSYWCDVKQNGTISFVEESCATEKSWSVTYTAGFYEVLLKDTCCINESVVFDDRGFKTAETYVFPIEQTNMKLFSIKTKFNNTHLVFYPSNKDYLSVFLKCLNEEINCRTYVEDVAGVMIIQYKTEFHMYSNIDQKWLIGYQVNEKSLYLYIEGSVKQTVKAQFLENQQFEGNLNEKSYLFTGKLIDENVLIQTGNETKSIYLVQSVCESKGTKRYMIFEETFSTNFTIYENTRCECTPSSNNITN
ncbi:hypothetical protein EIN_375800 [Entamoeba invadens IP1]|uniref:Uncharacterized protein n=1 Tax=Entamoeba invadens IP1 TaxID=370355 RepID=A0A0A1TU62_ENTIV|nr:hypothetical protein EIN_375800 [Entamoeba invadens IP1]ELP83455.1 hypothetical protein EIN_375800 [Entamoeba invadens IP1]|eukprot:XP_004182801.1 hypothetical protein EIN_375800 [Entamoeba invadens IP1]